MDMKDRKRLTVLEVDKLIAAARDTPLIMSEGKGFAIGQTGNIRAIFNAPSKRLGINPGDSQATSASVDVSA
jgi:hypothetical protein